MLGTAPQVPRYPLDLEVWGFGVGVGLTQVECGRRFVVLHVVLLRRSCRSFYHLVRTSNTSVLTVPLPSPDHDFVCSGGLTFQAAFGWQSIDVELGLVKSILWEKPLSPHIINARKIHRPPSPPRPPPTSNSQPPRLQFVCLFRDSHTYPPQYLFSLLFRDSIHGLGMSTI